MYRAALIPSPRLPQKCLHGTRTAGGRGDAVTPPTRTQVAQFASSRMSAPLLSSHVCHTTSPLSSPAPALPPQKRRPARHLSGESSNAAHPLSHTHIRTGRAAPPVRYISLSLISLWAYYASATIDL